MKKYLILIAMFLVALPQMIMAQDMAVPADPEIKQGKLDNGLTYYIRHNEWPEKRAYFYIAQKVGSMQEDDNQRGLAHFLEHMCFNGTTHFPGNNLKTYLEKIGVKFGENLNAYTAFDQTVYNIDNVNVEVGGAIDSCLLILHDWSHDLLLEDKEIDKERGVINEEWRMRSSAAQRMQERALPEMYPGSKYANRMPIGTMDIVMNFPYDAIRSYYRKWYRPDLQAIIIVGDVDVNEIEQKIKSTFADIAPAPADAAVREYYPVPDNQEPLFSFQQDKEQQYTSINMFWKRDVFPREMRQSLQYILYQYLQGAASSMFGDRIAEILQKENAPFLGAQLGFGNYFAANTKDAMIGATACPDNGYETSIKALYREILRAVRGGFTVSEYERFKTEYLSQIEKAYQQRDKIYSSNFVNACVDNFLENEPMNNIEWEYEVMNQLVPAIPLDAINESMKALPDSNLVVLVMAPDKEGITKMTKEQLITWMHEVEAEDIEPYKEEVNDEPLIANLPKPGKVKSIKPGIFDSKVITLSNGIKVNVKKTDFAPNRISMYAHSWGGNSLYSNEEYAQTQFVDLVSIGGIGNFSSTDLQKKLAGIQASASTSVDTNKETVSGSCVKKDFETMLQLAYLNFTAPRKDVEAFNATIQRAKKSMENQELKPTTALSDTIASVIYNNNVRAVRTKAADLDKIDYDRIIQIYKERFADADDFEFFIIGDCDADTIAPLLAKYLGALPVLKGSENFKKVDLSMAKGEIKNVFEKHQETPNAIVQFLYHTPMAVNLKNSLTVDMLKQVMQMLYTESVREDEGGAYGVPVNASMQRYPNEIASVTIQLPTAPEKREKMTEIIYKGVEDMVNLGPKEEDVQKVKEYMLRAHEEDLKSNGYWMGEMVEHALYGNDDVTPYVETIKSITAADIQAVAKAIFKSGNRIEVGMTSPAGE